MSSALEMSLDDLIKNKKISSRRGRGQGFGPGPVRRFPNRGSNRTTPYSKAKEVQASDSLWAHNMFTTKSGGGASTTKLYISNLDYGVSNEDIKGLFSEFGGLKWYSVHYDKSGRSKGTAEVVFSRRVDAVSAVKRYNNVQLDGKPMKIEVVGTNLVTPVFVPPVTNGMFGKPNGVPRSGQRRGGAVGRSRGGGSLVGRGFVRGRGQGRGRGVQISAEDLDADLQKYHSEAMQIN